MANRCEICGRGPAFGNQISHSHRKSRRKWSVNIQRIRVVVNGKVKRMKVCTRCLKSGRVKKPAFNLV